MESFDTVTRQGGSILTLFWIELAISAVLLAGVVGVMTVALVRFRARTPEEPDPPQVHRSRRLEIVIELVRRERVVQAWRLAEWEQGVYSIVRSTLALEGGGTRVVVDKDGYPANFHDVLANNWRQIYFKPMANTSQTSRSQTSRR